MVVNEIIVSYHLKCCLDKLFSIHTRQTFTGFLLRHRDLWPSLTFSHVFTAETWGGGLSTSILVAAILSDASEIDNINNLIPESHIEENGMSRMARELCVKICIALECNRLRREYPGFTAEMEGVVFHTNQFSPYCSFTNNWTAVPLSAWTKSI